MPDVMTEPLWVPTQEDIEHARMTEFARFVRARLPGAPPLDSMRALYDWSIAQREAFWPLVWQFCAVVADQRPSGLPWGAVGVGLDRMAPPSPDEGPRWFPGARLNFAENLLRFRDERRALTFWNESGFQRALTFFELSDAVARFAASLRAAGIVAGDRVAGFMPNMPETVIAMLAAASLGAVWSSCSPDFGARGVLDRFAQIEPRVLVAADGYRYAGKEIDCLERLRAIVDAMPSIERVVVVPYLRERPAIEHIRSAELWADFSWKGELTPEFLRLPFDHPLYIMFSSGTTGLPKCMVHSAGGTLLQHLKEHVLHGDLRPESVIFYFTTCGWMMWNWLVSALAVGATVVLYDGAPLAPRPEILWDMAAAERVSVFGTSAKYLALLQKQGASPRTTHELPALRAILSTGSPLAAHSYDYVHEHIAPAARLSSISGGTDIISCFALGSPISPVWRGELQTRGLGMAVDVWNERGEPVRGEAGELVCTRPFPSMPTGFWNDADGRKYRAAYFEHFPGVWRHGDWAELTEHDGLVIHGRSDATLNPGGVRIGTAEIYRQVEQLPEVIESLVVGQDVRDGVEVDTRIVLFVRLRADVRLDDALCDRIRAQIRANTSPHHVPRKIVQVADLPRTISGKITELAVREVIHGRPVTNVDAMANPEALELFRNLAELRS